MLREARAGNVRVSQRLKRKMEPDIHTSGSVMMDEDDRLSERGLSNSRKRYDDDDDDEDYHSIYIGVPMPRGYRRKRRRRRSASSRDKTSENERLYERQDRSDTDEGGQASYDNGNDNASRTMSPAAERLRYILGEDDDPPNPTLFTEMDTLQHDGEEMEWKESARWIKFEEKVEEGGERWSKPHVSTLSLHSLFELRTCLQTGTVLLDLDGYSLPQIIDDVIEKQIEDGLLKPELREKISYVLLRKHRHQTKKPIHRSLADIGKSVSSNTNRSPVRSPAAGASFHRSTEDLRMRQNANYGRLRHAQSRSMNDITDTPSTDQVLKNKFIKKIPKDAEASNVLVGEVDFLEKPFVAFVRLIQSTMLGGVTEVPVPTRFLFILLGPSGKAKSYNEIGRAIATLMVDDLFSDVAYKARDRDDLIAGIDEFLDEVIVLPPGEWDPNIRIEPPKKVPSAEKRKSVFSLNEAGQMNGTAGGAAGGSGGGGGGGSGSDSGEMPAVHEVGEELVWTGRFCGGLYLDIKRKLPWFPSDFYEGFHIQSISAILFIYLGCITNAITFGGLLGDATDNYQYNAINVTALDWTQLSKKECLKYGGSLVGKSCKFVPDLALMSFILFFGTYSMTVTLKKFKFSRYFPTKVRAFIADFSIVFSILLFCGIDAWFGLDTPKLHVPSIIKLRKLISDFSIFMSILMFVGLDVLFGLNTPKLQVPTDFKPTRLDRGWFVFPFGKNPWWIYLASALPALLVTILIFMDQQITAVIVNRKEHKLRKAAGYHLDLFWVGVLMAVCSFMGLPWYVAATVISIAHIDSLKMETETSAPGEQPQFLGVREQRVTGIIVFVLTGISVFLAPILKYIPMPVLYGVFLYMGVASLNGIQFWDRCKLFLMPAKHQPDYAFLRHVPLRRIHLFTLVQIICLAILWILKSTVAAIIFPVMILALILVRKMLDFVFSQHDLAWIDNIIPEREKKKEDDKKKKKKGNKGEEESEDEERGPPVGALRSDSSPNGSDLDRSITLHLKISCPSSPAFNYSRNPLCAVPQVKIEMESDYEDSDTEKHPRDMGSETTL
ncbi:electrogenic sodium bicarbonate cotransporter 4 [Gopherus flavomarginatus]|uniref:electrogenic sodium bicarbonate cotransporter 4 n=1 Tax=Gopherus flavomarginatus TaxID=286002 RepID=UPI0021CBFA17|nr:electrogenic sodium bicarbonate cotransporter 4 [Gopherus flavomarginatus]